MFADSDYESEVRSPQNIGWLKNVNLSGFDLSATVRSTEEDYAHRDVCLLFNRVDATHFYYVHLATKADDHAHSIFLVNGGPRVSIARERTDGIVWDDKWHQVRVVRDSDSGLIEVYFDDRETPIMKAVDKTFLKGSIGFGSFDDTADLKEMVVRGR